MFLHTGSDHGGCLQSKASGQNTAERTTDRQKKCFHTVSSSTPREKRFMGSRQRRVCALPPIDRRNSRTSHLHSKRLHISAISSQNSREESLLCSMTTEKEVSIERQSNPTILSSANKDIVSRIATLAALRDQGFISDEEYERRKNTIIDELTFSSISVSSRLSVTHIQRSSFKVSNGLPTIIPHAPDFSESTPELATKHVFDYEKRQWSSTKVYVNLDETPFSKGSLRVVYHLQDLNETQYDGTYVAKLAIDPDEDPQTYFRDIELQAHCAHYARVYNSYNPPKRVEFIKAWILELTERNGALCAVEPYIPGEYRKHNNNFGCVSEDERNTPQAFSHFTYEASNHELLAVDIQGVGDKYTDPQIHTLNGDDFGKGNLGVFGFQKFLSSHRCNSICRYLKLPPVNPKESQADYGTVPLQELMNKEKIRSTHFDSTHYYENAPMLQKYITQCRELESKQQRKNRHSATTVSSRLSFSCYDMEITHKMFGDNESHSSMRCTGNPSKFCGCVIS